MMSYMESDLELLKTESYRYVTFANWPVQYYFMDCAKMAQAGFYYLNKDDHVKCAFCKVEMMNWQHEDDPLEEHARWAPQCSYVKSIMSDANVCSEQNYIADQESYKNKPMLSSYITYENRLKSFDNWPQTLIILKSKLAEAGWVYTGKDDITICFHCGGKLSNWTLTHEPWREHARWYRNCDFVVSEKGKDFVQTVITEACVEKEGSNSDNQTTECDIRTCKVCFVNERNYMFLPCHHLACCEECAFKVKKCVVCRRSIDDMTKVFIS
ncbi:apoptosis inhibitor 3 [Helicoverpa armigera NPV strain Australia]|nr:apoptosis inhibitor 3 [Helicoverpa armigera NPV strain Australia]